MKNNNGKAPALLIFLIVIVLIALCATVFMLVNASKESTSGTENPQGEPAVLEPLISNVTTNTTVEDVNTVTEPSVSKVDLEASSFTTRFLKLEPSGKNLIYSPLSIQYALQMLRDGASGETRTQIENVVGDYKLPKYQSIEKVLSLANGVFIRESFKNRVLNDYKNRLIDKYDAEIVYDGFVDATNVNKWISDKTMGIIPNMLKDEMFTSNQNLEMILANALAIDMAWKVPFDDEGHTMSKDFTLDTTEVIQAATLNNTVTNDAVSYYKGSDVTALAMDLDEYEDTQFQFVAIMPNNTSLGQYAKSFEYKDLDTILGKLKSSAKEKDGVKFYIPRFTYDYDLALKSDLMQMGIVDAFSDMKADFYKMTGDQDLYVSDALHTAKIEFTNKGIKAAAVTVFAMSDKAMAFEEPKKPVVVEINKPFLYVIRDKATDEVWFVGTMYNPETYKEYQEAESKRQDEAQKERQNRIGSQTLDVILD